MAGRWDAILTHDIPGLRLRRGTPPTPEGPSPAVRRALVELLPTRSGARRDASLARRVAGVGGLGRGARWAVPLRARASARARLAVVGHPHRRATPPVSSPPIIRSAPASPTSRVTDELYCCPVFEDDVVPLLRTDASMDGRLFTSTYEHVVVGEADGTGLSRPSAGERPHRLGDGRRAQPGRVRPAGRLGRHVRPRAATDGSSPTRWRGWPQPMPTSGPPPTPDRCRRD